MRFRLMLRVGLLGALLVAVFPTLGQAYAVGHGLPRLNLQAGTGTLWQWESTVGRDGTRLVPGDSTRYTLLLAPDWRAQVRADCNRGGGPYSIEGDQLSIGPLVSTRMACPPGGQGNEFVRQLEQAQRYALDGGALVIQLADGASMRFRGASGAPGAGTPMVRTTPVGPTWRWEGNVVGGVLQPVPADPNRRYTLQLQEGGRAAVTFDCNTGGGGYTLEGSNLTFGPMITSLAACPPGSLATEYAQALDQARGWRFEDDALLIDLAGGAGSMRFRLDEAASAVPAVPLSTALVGPVWQWERTLLNLATLVPPDPSRYTLQFQADGRLAAQVDCNRGMGSYTLEGNRLTIGPLATTMIGCPPGSMASEFTRYLPDVQLARVEGDTLTLEIGTDTGVMRFRRAPGAAAP